MRRVLILFAMFAALTSFASGQNAYAGSQAPVSGKVVETMDAGRYTYVCLEKGGKKTWLAVPQIKVVKGKNMSFEPGIEMVNFESKILKRKFDKIIFSAGPAKE